MRYLITLFLAALLVTGFVTTANAADVTRNIPCGTISYSASCDVPTARTDTTPLPLSEIDHFNFYINSAPLGSTPDNNCAFDVPLNGLVCGSLYVIQATTVDTLTSESALSPDRLLIQLGKADPNPPANLR